jgi:hypothetical protein
MALAYSSSDPTLPDGKFLRGGYPSNNAMNLPGGSGNASSRSSLTRPIKMGVVGPGKIISAWSTAFSGDCTPARLGATFPKALALGKPSTVASGAGGAMARGPTYSPTCSKTWSSTAAWAARYGPSMPPLSGPAELPAERKNSRTRYRSYKGLLRRNSKSLLNMRWDTPVAASVPRCIC